MTWRVAATTRELGRRPLAVTVAGRHLVLFRGPDGRPRALEDRCPHRGVPLSLGRCSRGTIECAYHGWRFDGAGTLLAVPSNVDDARPAAAVPAYAAAERDGFVWVADGGEPVGAPPDLHLTACTWRRWRLIEGRPADVLRAALEAGGGVHLLAPDHAETAGGGTRTILLLVPETPERTRVEVLVGRWTAIGWSRWVRDAGWPVPLGAVGEASSGDWRLETPLPPIEDDD